MDIRKVIATQHTDLVPVLRAFVQMLRSSGMLHEDVPAVALISDLCDALMLDKADKTQVLGLSGMAALHDLLETKVALVQAGRPRTR